MEELIGVNEDVVKYFGLKPISSCSFGIAIFDFALIISLIDTFLVLGWAVALMCIVVVDEFITMIECNYCSGKYSFKP